MNAVTTLLAQDRPQTSWLGIALAITSLMVMPLLGRAKQRLGVRLGSAATAGEGAQNLLCAYLAVAVLAGLLANTLWGWWWLDPVVALGIAALAVWEGIQSLAREWVLLVGRSALVVGFRRGHASEVAIFEPVAVALEGDDFGVVHQAVDHRRGHDVIAEDFAPPAEGLVAGDDQRGPFVA